MTFIDSSRDANTQRSSRPNLSAATLSNSDQALVQIGRYLRSQRYRFVTVTPATHARVQASANEWACDLRDIFGWNKPFRDDLLAPPLLAWLRAAQVLQPYRDGWHCSVRFSQLNSLLLMHSSYPTTSDDAVFFGPDTYRFYYFLSDFLQRHSLPLQRVADVGCGSGAAAIAIARHYPQTDVYAFDINARALQYARINAALAEVDNVNVEHSNLLHESDGNFDLIVANPPYMVDHARRAYRHGGGLFGAELSLALVDDALPRLRAGGTLLLYTGAAVVGGDDVLCNALQRRLDNADVSWSYREIDPDVFGEEIGSGAYAQVERIAAIGLIVTRRLHPARRTSAVCTATENKLWATETSLCTH